MKRIHLIAFTAAVGVMLSIGAPRAGASAILVTTETGITNDGLLSWGALCTIHTPPCLPNPFTMIVPGIAGLTITASGANVERRDQGSDWLGNFGPGEPLLFTISPGLMDFVFDAAISGFGSQIQANNLPFAFYPGSVPFTARIEAFDASNASLGFFTVDGNSTSPFPSGDDSAIFIGILSSDADIRRVTVDVPAFQNFAINSPRIQAGSDGAVSPVPEPTSMMLLGTGFAALIARRHRRSSRS